MSPSVVILSETERQELKQILNRHSSPQQLVQRVKIILLAGEQQNNRQIARNLSLSREMVRLWRGRWLETATKEIDAIARLSDAERSGAPIQFTMEQVMRLFAIACQPPMEYGYPISHWTARELADVMINEQVVESISVRHVGRLLEEADLKPHQIKYWLNTKKN